MTPATTATPTQRLSLAQITTAGNKLPNRYGLHAVEGWGKTSLGAMFPKPLFIQTRGETGLETLIDSRRLPPTAHLPEIMSWPDLRSLVRMVASENHDYKTLVLDTANGAEKLCCEAVMKREFDNSREKFLAFGKGPIVAADEWREFLGELDEVRQRRKMIIWLLVHTKVNKFRNPEGSDFDRYQPELEPAIWSLTHKWLDVVLFGNFLQTTTEDKATKRAKGIGGDQRMLYCTRTAAWDAKNRIGLPSEISIGDSPQEAYAQFTEAVKAGCGTASAATKGENK